MRSHDATLYPDIPIDKLTNSLSKYAFNPEEKVFVVDTTPFGSAKNGLVFTDKRIIWKEFLQESGHLTYEDLHNFNNWRKLPEFVDKNEDKDFGELLVKLSEMYPKKQIAMFPTGTATRSQLHLNK